MRARKRDGRESGPRVLSLCSFGLIAGLFFSSALIIAGVYTTAGLSMTTTEVSQTECLVCDCLDLGSEEGVGKRSKSTFLAFDSKECFFLRGYLLSGIRGFEQAG